MALDDILNAFMGGGIPQQGQASAAAGDPLAEMLQGILGGGMGGAAPQGMGAGMSPGMLPGMSGGDPLGGLLEAILGGGMAQGATPGSTQGGMPGGMGILPGMDDSMGANALLAPLADALAKKLGLPPEIAMMVVSFLGAKLLSGGQAKPTGARQGKSGRGKAAQTQSLDLDSLLETMGADKGMAKELAEQTGLDPATAERSLQEAIGMIGGAQEARKPKPSNRPSGGGLDSLLDTW